MKDVKNLPLINNLEEIVNGRLSPAVARFMADALATDPIDGSSCASLELLEKLSSRGLAQTVKESLLGVSEEKRWGIVHCHQGDFWNVRVRLSQRDGLEFTRAHFLPTGVRIKRHKFYPVSFELKRSQCVCSPFVASYKNGFAVNAVYTTHKIYTYLVQTFFHSSGRTVSRVFENCKSKHPIRYVYCMEVENPTLYDANGEIHVPDALPVSSGTIMNTPDQPILRFENVSKGCCLHPPPNIGWEFMLTHDYPESKKTMPMTRKVALFNFNCDSGHLVLQTHSSNPSSLKIGPMLSLGEQSTRFW